MKFTLYFIALGFAGFAQAASVSGSSSLLPGNANTASAAWIAHFDQFRQQHEPLSPAQSAVVDTATDLAKQGQNFDPKAMSTLKDDAISAFGFKDAKSLLATMDNKPLRTRDDENGGIQCGCSTQSDWCDSGYHCVGGGCTQTGSGCGTLYGYPCDGLCSIA
ncbi:hypothetical protein IFM58399_06426 [Aspergillus lentulus]|uniref:Uncharacterized protein n=1 Tax=Aspergillus lentulus TaxID=293939 RepID=A0ABQ1AM06_ASPLE|nr:uncharacterized protein IFM58399_06426 [Aspergillus lentulus]KAF4153211.1 hypothetical protein CNMCM6069_001104 [Aspergillus lentulus]KAF4163632.1 hypothetical protein CNMCM6936_000551 [Aspergillus lentulus]GFF41903.1 hypothetical protein IFM58399_06426 [Aspergillus lentulus]GFF84212.1 hypothetical protein IFM60648_06953 [Aspergillus lentulus]